MTAEAVAMNKMAVAMAADSAVTISSGRGGLKTYDTANKLFELIRGRPVGIMIYSNAEVNGVPWETLIKRFREVNAGLHCGTLREYADRFLAFLSDSDNSLLTDESEDKAYENAAYEVLLNVIGLVEKAIPSCMTSTGKLVQTRLVAATRDAISVVEKMIGNYPDATWKQDLEDAHFRERFEPTARRLVGELFAQMKILQRDKAALVDLCMNSFLKQSFVNSESGLVIAGFGDDDAFPSLLSMSVRGRVAGVLQVEEVGSNAIGFGRGEGGVLVPFAQNEMANQYLYGINDRTRGSIISWWQDWIHNTSIGELAAASQRAQPRLADATARAIAMEQQQLMTDRFDDFLHHMNDHLHREFVEPLQRSVALLPKDELALVAESLVNLASLRQRMMIDQMQTVGGEIDVGLISRGDGFVWIQRKHYFSLDLNPTWIASHRPERPNVP